MPQPNVTPEEEHARTGCFVLGGVGTLEDLVKRLRQRAGDAYARGRDEEARILRQLAQEFEAEARRARDKWQREYRDATRREPRRLDTP